jgi:hypothetical protein
VSSDPPRSPARIFILYEDSRGPTNGFGLHKLVLAATHDVLGESGSEISRHVLEKRIVDIPKRSDGKVLAAIRDDGERLHAGHSALVAWLDDDKIHRTLGLAANASQAAKLAAIRSYAPSLLVQRQDALEIHLVNGNTETFLEACHAVRPGALSPETFAAALAKDRTARDLCFAEIAKQIHGKWRAELRGRDPGFDAVIRHLARLASHEPWPPW